MSPVDQRGQLEAGLFSYQATKDGQVRIAWRGQTVTLLRGPAARKLIDRLHGLDNHGVQLALAKATGNFKRGNEQRNQLPPETDS